MLRDSLYNQFRDDSVTCDIYIYNATTTNFWYTKLTTES